MSEPHPLYADVAALLNGTMPDPPAPAILARSDGHALFYTGQVNLVFGDPESGKTWVALAAAAEALRDGGSALVLDLDHNGMQATVQRLLMLGAPGGALSDLQRFRYVEPEDAPHLVDVVADVVAWRPDVTVLDSIGELLPLFGVSSNSPDDFTMVHSRVMKPLAAKADTALIAIDHLAKNSESRALGATGTAAKRRAIGGVSLRVKLLEAFTPGRGGAALLTIHKDRHGGLRAVSPAEDKEPVAGTFKLSTVDGATSWRVHAPAGGERNPAEAADPADVDALRQMDPQPVSVRDVQERMTWRRSRAADALREYRRVSDTSAESVRFPGSHTQGAEPGTAPGATRCAACGEPSTYPIHPTCEEAPR
ncbi:recombinase RecA [Brachybacterium vulturis]|uniref:recombinase RecA n=1 Tax=Brachybacterium vulturis TaxID=2017484 RepID=UPI0015AAA61B|nr:recombinase RecA [Brachybacterium vulturis]